MPSLHARPMIILIDPGDGNYLRALVQILHKILREKDIECPVDGHPNLLLQTWQFAPVNPAPEKPGEKSGEVDTENSRHTRAPADGGEKADDPAIKRSLFFATPAYDDVMCQSFSFARG